jgi:hypothetical protein
VIEEHGFPEHRVAADISVDVTDFFNFYGDDSGDLYRSVVAWLDDYWPQVRYELHNGKRYLHFYDGTAEADRLAFRIKFGV